MVNVWDTVHSGTFRVMTSRIWINYRFSYFLLISLNFILGYSFLSDLRFLDCSQNCFLHRGTMSRMQLPPVAWINQHAPCHLLGLPPCNILLSRNFKNICQDQKYLQNTSTSTLIGVFMGRHPILLL